MEELKEKLKKYKELDLKLKENVINDKYIDSILKERELLFEEIKSANFDKDMFRKILNEEKILELEEEIKYEIKKQKVNVQKRINSLKKTNQANKMYRNTYDGRMSFLKKI